MPYKDIEKRREYLKKYMREYRKNAEYHAKELESRKRYYHAHKEQEIRNVDIWRLKNKEQVQRNYWRRNSKKRLESLELRFRALQYLGGECAGCGTQEWVCLDFHHLEPKEKSFSISVKISKAVTWEFIRPEVDKCVLLCRNCHAIYHWGSWTEIWTNRDRIVAEAQTLEKE